jgi:mitochondrial import inner membrane translocase subunit TIM44
LIPTITINFYHLGWNNFKSAYDESNNIFVYMAREVTDRISGKISSIFAETDTARAMRELKERDPHFSTEKFMKTVREFIIPEILDAFLSADIPTLRMWCSEGTFNVLKANFEAQLKPGVVFSGKVLDLRNLEVFYFFYLRFNLFI